MSNDLSKAREKLAEQILEDFKGKITGECEEYVINENPENKYFVGKLLTKSDDVGTSFGSDVFIESIGLDFYINEDKFYNANIKLCPRGVFYYRVYPSLEQQRKDMLENVNLMHEEHYDSFDELYENYIAAPEKFKKIKRKILPVFKKIDINPNESNFDVKLSDIMVDDAYGVLGPEHPINTMFDADIDLLKESLNEDPRRYTYQIYEETTIPALKSEESFHDFLENNAKRDISIHQNWHLYFYIYAKKVKDRFIVSTSLLNDSMVQSNDVTHKSNSKSKDKITIETLFNAGLDVTLEGGSFSPVILDYFLDDYKYNNEEMAIGQNCSVTYDKSNNRISTDNLPTFVQKRLITNDSLAVKFDDLVNNPILVLQDIKKKMYEELDRWKKYHEDKANNLTAKGNEKMLSEIAEFELEIKRFVYGIHIIELYPSVQKSFILMNKAFKNTSKKYNTWRLFQIVYIVSLIPDIVACDKNIMPEEDKAKTTLESVSLLFFPTGGGKTEAFLGILVFNLFFDRFRGKNCGVTSILRYPLRLLSVQQVQRLANTLAQAELLRREDPSICNTDEFSLGYFVGDNNTPNKIKKEDVEGYRNKTQSDMDKNRIVDICPYCGMPTVHVKFDEETYRLMHICSNLNCKSGGILPIYMVDTEIYRYLPSAIISTVDKLAILGNNANFRNIISGAPYRCPKHGYTSARRCIVNSTAPEFCDVGVDRFEEVNMYDPAPTLFIQDELHLIRESLGTYASHYESFINYYVKNVSPSKRAVKVIGATATISSYKEQISQLYNHDPIRFPCESPYPDKNFYAYTDEEDTQRLIMGYAPYGKAIINAVVYSLKYMREVVYKYFADISEVLNIPGIGDLTEEEAFEILKDYWIFLEYNNVKRDGNNVDGALDTPINGELRAENVKPFITRKMTGDETFQDVREVLAQVENSDNVYDDLNLIIATSMISHGVDADKFNIMFFFGMPGNMAEYIQAYSRTGRRYSSIVIDIMRPSRETDQSYLKNFKKFHEFKDIMVEAVPINRWAIKAIDCTIPGIFMGLLFMQYEAELQYSVGSFYKMKNIKTAVKNHLIEKDTIKEQLYQAYACEISGDIVSLGNQYKEKIDHFIDDIFFEIEDRTWIEESIFKGFESMGYHIMNSLRDTDSQVIIELE